MQRCFWRIPAVLVLLLTVGAAGMAEDSKKLVDHTAGPPTPANKENEYSRVIKIRPKLAPPQVSSRLYPSRAEQRPGNAAPVFLRQNYEASESIQLRRELLSDSEQLNRLTLDDPQFEKIVEANLYRLKELDRASLKLRSGWEYPLDDQDGMWTHIPDVQESRLCIDYLTVYARHSIGKGDLRQAERCIRIGLGLSSHVGDTPFPICKLVQGHNVLTLQSAIEELIQHPDAPNMYWDLVSLPRPMVDLRPAIQWDSQLFAQTYPKLKELDKLGSPEEWDRLWDDILLAIITIDSHSLPPNNSKELQALKDKWLSLSKERLPKSAPHVADRVKSMGDSEVSVRYWWLRYLEMQDMLLPAAMLEMPTCFQAVVEHSQKVDQEFAGEDFVHQGLLELNIVPIYYVADLEQRFALLRTVEAIRHWSAENSGQLPASLSNLTLPIPKDPLSGEAFQYVRSADEKSARLGGKILWFTGDKHKRGATYTLQVAEVNP